MPDVSASSSKVLIAPYRSVSIDYVIKEHETNSKKENTQAVWTCYSIWSKKEIDNFIKPTITPSTVNPSKISNRNLGNDAIELGQTLAGKYKFCSGQAQTYEAMKNSSTKCGSCWAWSDALYTELNKLGYHVRIIQYRTSRAVNHRSVQYMNTNGVWVDYPYRSVGLTTGMQSTNSKPGLSLVRENKIE